MIKARSLIVIVLAAFAIYIAMQDPNGSAGIIRNGVQNVWAGLGNLWDFATALFTGR
jgi:hypothetical protein